MTFDPLYILVAAACVSLVAFVVILVRLKAMGRPEPILDDWDAIGSDFQAVGDDMRKAMADAKHKMARDIRERIENTTL